MCFFFSSRRRHTRCALVTGVQTCSLPIFSAYAAPLWPLEAGADTFAGQIPTILKMNSSNSWATSIDQAVTASVDDALRLGCPAIGFTIYRSEEGRVGKGCVSTCKFRWSPFLKKTTQT